MSPLTDTELRIGLVVDDMTVGDRKKAAYLCGSLAGDCSVALVRETLRGQQSQLYIMSILRLLGRYDILKKVYEVGRCDLEGQIPSCGQALPRFRVLMVSISEDLDKEDVEKIKFLLGRTLTREKAEISKTFLEVVIELEKLDYVSEEKVELVEQCLHHISRLDLLKKVTAYRTSVCNPHLPPHQMCLAEEPRKMWHCQAAATSKCFSPPPQSSRATAIRQMQTSHVAASARAPLHRESSSGAEIEHYNLTTDPRGLCVIIDSVGKDGETLAKTFEALRFTVDLYSILAADEIYDTLKAISRNGACHKGDAFVCCVVSRRMSDKLLGTNSYGSGLSVEMVRRLFVGDACPALVGKPKLFFIQSYAVAELDHSAREEYMGNSLEVDGCQSKPTSGNIPLEADVFWSQCTADASQLREEQHRSVYLKALTDALSKARRNSNLLDIHVEVNAAIYSHNENHPEANYYCDVKHTLRKNLYLK